jgi:hypothetical protein
MRLSCALAALVFALAACAGHTDIYAGTIDVMSATLVPISPGSSVSVLADADQPVFATDHAYWLYREGGWYRADDYHRSAWVRIAAPPERLRSIAHPLAYRHFEQHDSSTAILVRPAP